MGQLEDLRAFVHIVEQESIGKAAEQAGIAKSAMSRKLKLLEERLNTALIVRTTRQWALTEAGRQFYERGLRVLDIYDEFETDVQAGKEQLRGPIRLSVPLYFGKAVLTPLLLEFVQENPDVHLDVDFNDRMVDVVAENFDLVLRIADLADSTLIARRLCQTHHALCASEAYLASHPPVSQLQDLKQHHILQYGSQRRPKWTLTPPKGNSETVTLSARLNSHDGGFLVDAAEKGLGIALLPDFMVEDSLAAGRLTTLLTDHTQPARGIYVVYPAARHLPFRTRSLVDFLLQQLRMRNKPTTP